MSDIILPGNAASGDVKTGKTFSSSSGAGVAGTMPVNTGTTTTPTTADQTIPTGYHDGTTKIKGDPNLLAANILSGKTIFGVAGSAGRSASGTVTSGSSTIGFTNNTNGSTLAYPVTVSGLTFIPSVVVVLTTNTTTDPEIVIAQSKGDISQTGSRIADNYNGTETMYKLDGTTGYLNSGGFRLPVQAASASYTWYAYE